MSEDVSALPLAARIRLAREQAGLSQETLAAKLGTSRRHVMRWESRRNPVAPGEAYAARLAEVTGAPVWWFYDSAFTEAELLQALLRTSKENQERLRQVEDAVGRLLQETLRMSEEHRADADLQRELRGQQRALYDAMLLELQMLRRAFEGGGRGR